MERRVDLLIIGAGPFGLSMAAQASGRGIEYLAVGKPMGFWRENMPVGMYLRSDCDWHLDPLGVHTIDSYLETQGLRRADVEPLSLSFYLGYARWFEEQLQIQPTPVRVRQLDHIEGRNYAFRASLESGEVITARRVVIAVGFEYFKNRSQSVINLFPPGRFTHTCDLVDFSGLRGRRCLIIGGRQSAFEWAALLNESGAAAVHVSHRHDSPAFAAADWSWVKPFVDGMAADPWSYLRLSEEEKRAISRRLWVEGRLKIEPWLEPRIKKDTIKLWPRTQVAACRELPDGELRVTLDNGQALHVDDVILATGYRVQIDQVPFLARGNMLGKLVTRNGFPVLDEQLQSSVPGLFITSMAATQDFGPFFAFTVSARTSAKLIGKAIAR